VVDDLLNAASVARLHWEKVTLILIKASRYKYQTLTKPERLSVLMTAYLGARKESSITLPNRAVISARCR
jgi:hypothetical protein